MSYSPTNWASGDIITSEKLNKIEQGIVGLENGTGCFLVNVNSDGVCDKIAGQIKAAVLAGKQVVFKSEKLSGMITQYDLLRYFTEDDGYFEFYAGMMINAFKAESENDYPSIIQEKVE